MSMYKNLLFPIFVTVFTVMFFISGNLFADDTTIIGEVDDQHQIIGTDGEIYTVVINDVARKIVTEHINEIVKVTGTVEYSEDGDMLSITAKRFEVMNSDYVEALYFDEEPDYIEEYEDNEAYEEYEEYEE